MTNPGWWLTPLFEYENETINRSISIGVSLNRRMILGENVTILFENIKVHETRNVETVATSDLCLK